MAIYSMLVHLNFCLDMYLSTRETRLNELRDENLNDQLDLEEHEE